MVLVADDDEDVRFVVSALLERSGCEVTTVASAHAALDVLSSTRFDVLVLDERMPPGSGSEVIRALRDAGDETPAVRGPVSPHVGVATGRTLLSGGSGRLTRHSALRAPRRRSPASRWGASSPAEAS